VKLLQRLRQRSVPTLVRLACVLALCGLAVICCSVVFPRPLPVILAMSAGHAIGGAAFACYLLAVILDAAGHPPPPNSLPPAAVDKHQKTSGRA
jgi:hypothetical protein